MNLKPTILLRPFLSAELTGSSEIESAEVCAPPPITVQDSESAPSATNYATLPSKSKNPLSFAFLVAIWWVSPPLFEPFHESASMSA